MAYTKQNWECGDLITAEKMNHIEDGIEAASSGGSTEPLIIAYDHSTPQLLYYDPATQDYETLTYQMLQDALWSRPLTIVDGLLSGTPIPGDSIYFNFYSTDNYGNLTARNVSMDSNSTVTEWYAIDFTGTPRQ